jgi:V/A-type H+-transporting ATPase subunit E
MSLEKLLESIEHEARAEAAGIVGRARQEAAQLVAQAEAEARAEADAWGQARLAEGRQRAAQHVAQARLEARSRLLRVQQELVDAVFDEALATLRRMDDDAYRAWMRQRVLATCSADEETVVVSEGDRDRLSPAWQADVAGALGQQGLAHVAFRFTGDDLGGGFVVQHPRYEIDVRFASLLHALRAQKRAEVAAVLFGQ